MRLLLHSKSQSCLILIHAHLDLMTHVFFSNCLELSIFLFQDVQRTVQNFSLENMQGFISEGNTNKYLLFIQVAV